MIGIFDSGFGGLTVVKEVMYKLPCYSYTYLGDNARAPYGNRSQEVIYEYTKQAIDFLALKGCSLIIIACNTASAEALRKIQQDYLPVKHPSLKVLGVIRPTVEIAISKSKKGIIGVVGTRSTIDSKAYIYEIEHLAPRVKVYQQACPLLVPLIEEGWDKKPETKMIIKKYVQYVKSCHVDSLILGCTHYPILQKEFERKMGKRVAIISSAQCCAEKLADYLQRHPEIEEKLVKEKQVSFFTTDDPERFVALGSRFLGQKIKKEHVKKVHL